MTSPEPSHTPQPPSSAPSPGSKSEPPLHLTRGGESATRPEKHADMVRWLHPAQLVRTGLDALVAAMFGARADHRLIEAVVRPQVPFFDYSEEGDEDFWLDYVADTGDGWNSTYAVARLLALPSLTLQEPEGTACTLERGRILIFGGDEVYPGASRETYQDRLVHPYEKAMGRTENPSPDLFSIPGNHDWYDGLSSYMRLFCANRWFAGRRTRQSRSYFALKLPRGWWLIGTDVQLNSDIDVPQVEYFRQLVPHMKPEDRIILCNAEPAWIHAATSPPRRRGYLENNLEYLQEKVFGRSISLFLAGDLHHYRRHEGPEGRHKITAGGGGAFMHPTHAPAAPRLRDGYLHKKSFPDVRTSRKLARQNLLLIRHSPLFGLMTGALYLLLAIATYSEVGSLGLSHLSEVLGLVASSVVNRPWSITLGVATVGGLMGFADPAFGRWRSLAGGLHGLAHILAAFFVAWGSVYFTVTRLGICSPPPNLQPNLVSTAAALCTGGWTHLWAKFFLSSSLTFAGGFLLGPFIMGLYLMLSVNRFGAHSNEAFISLAIPDWKNFLRLRIDPDGELRVYPVGLERVPRRWKESQAGPYAPAYEPDDPRATEPVLIEAPIRVTPRRP